MKVPFYPLQYNIIPLHIILSNKDNQSTWTKKLTFYISKWTYVVIRAMPMVTQLFMKLQFF